jgi:LacI family transcriptional regulator
MPRRATIKDVAGLAGVSIKTVSRVINREPGVSLALIGRVEQAVADLDYRHNLAASNLRRGQRTLSIGLLLHDPRNTFSGTLQRAIEDRARRAGVAVLSASLDDDNEREAVLVNDLISRRVDGLVLMPTSADQGYLSADVRAGLAVVAVDRPARGATVDTVLVDNAAAARAATAHLVAHGHRRIACLADRQAIWTSGERQHGYEAGLSDAGIRPDPHLCIADLSTAGAATGAVLALFDPTSGVEPPTAVFAARNTLTIGAIRALHQLGLQRRVALVGFDDFPMSDLVDPAVTVVAQDVDTVGAQAAELLFARMGGSTEPPRELVVPTSLIQRGSGEIRAI